MRYLGIRNGAVVSGRALIRGPVRERITGGLAIGPALHFWGDGKMGEDRPGEEERGNWRISVQPWPGSEMNWVSPLYNSGRLMILRMPMPFDFFVLSNPWPSSAMKSRTPAFVGVMEIWTSDAFACLSIFVSCSCKILNVFSLNFSLIVSSRESSRVQYIFMG